MTLLKHKEFCCAYAYKSAFNIEDANTLTAQYKSEGEGLGAGNILLLNSPTQDILPYSLLNLYCSTLRPLSNVERICIYVMGNVICSSGQIPKPTLHIVLIQMPPHPNSVTLKKEAVSFCETSGKRFVLCDVATRMKVM